MLSGESLPHTLLLFFYPFPSFYYPILSQPVKLVSAVGLVGSFCQVRTIVGRVYADRVGDRSLIVVKRVRIV